MSNKVSNEGDKIIGDNINDKLNKKTSMKGFKRVPM